MKASEVSEKTGTGSSQSPQQTRQRSIVDQLEFNLATTESKTSIYRLLAIGSHSEAPDDIMKYKERLLITINANSSEEPGTGIFALYPKHFLHLLEGPEETINKYIKACATDFEERTGTGNEAPEQKALKVKMKILSFARVYKRSTDKWNSMVRSTPGGWDVETRFRGFRNRLYQFIKSVWILSSVYMIFMQPDDVAPPQDISEFSDPEDQALVVKANKNLEEDLELELNTYFPTIETLKYFLKPKARHPPLRSPKEHIEHAWELPNVVFDSETVWPIPCRLAPYD